MRRLGGTMWSSWALGRLENIGLGLDFGEMLQVSCVHESWYSVSNVENGRRHVCIVQHRIKYGQRYHHEYLKYVLIDLIYLAISPWYFCCQSNSLSISTCLVSTYRASCSVLPPQNLVSGPLLHKWLCVGYLPNLFPSPPPLLQHSVCLLFGASTCMWILHCAFTKMISSPSDKVYLASDSFHQITSCRIDYLQS